MTSTISKTNLLIKDLYNLEKLSQASHLRVDATSGKLARSNIFRTLYEKAASEMFGLPDTTSEKLLASKIYTILDQRRALFNSENIETIKRLCLHAGISADAVYEPDSVQQKLADLIGHKEHSNGETDHGSRPPTKKKPGVTLTIGSIAKLFFGTAALGTLAYALSQASGGGIPNSLISEDPLNPTLPDINKLAGPFQNNSVCPLSERISWTLPALNPCEAYTVLNMSSTLEENFILDEITSDEILNISFQKLVSFKSKDLGICDEPEIAYPPVFETALSPQVFKDYGEEDASFDDKYDITTNTPGYIEKSLYTFNYSPSPTEETVSQTPIPSLFNAQKVSFYANPAILFTGVLYGIFRLVKFLLNRSVKNEHKENEGCKRDPIHDIESTNTNDRANFVIAPTKDVPIENPAHHSDEPETPLEQKLLSTSNQYLEIQNENESLNLDNDSNVVDPFLEQEELSPFDQKLDNSENGEEAKNHKSLNDLVKTPLQNKVLNFGNKQKEIAQKPATNVKSAFIKISKKETTKESVGKLLRVGGSILSTSELNLVPNVLKSNTTKSNVSIHTKAYSVNKENVAPIQIQNKSEVPVKIKKNKPSNKSNPVKAPVIKDEAVFNMPELEPVPPYSLDRNHLNKFIHSLLNEKLQKNNSNVTALCELIHQGILDQYPEYIRPLLIADLSTEIENIAAVGSILEAYFERCLLIDDKIHQEIAAEIFENDALDFNSSFSIMLKQMATSQSAQKISMDIHSQLSDLLENENQNLGSKPVFLALSILNLCLPYKRNKICKDFFDSIVLELAKRLVGSSNDPLYGSYVKRVWAENDFTLQFKRKLIHEIEFAKVELEENDFMNSSQKLISINNSTSHAQEPDMALLGSITINALLKMEDFSKSSRASFLTRRLRGIIIQGDLDRHSHLILPLIEEEFLLKNKNYQLNSLKDVLSDYFDRCLQINNPDNQDFAIKIFEYNGLDSDFSRLMALKCIGNPNIACQKIIMEMHEVFINWIDSKGCYGEKLNEYAEILPLSLEFLDLCMQYPDDEACKFFVENFLKDFAERLEDPYVKESWDNLKKDYSEELITRIIKARDHDDVEVDNASLDNLNELAMIPV
ncbi:MAG TPA: hypothetical protein VGP47_01515 [Parachlamydiaceae bacterium]|nr:hypothetical protein [Parachlamydiaceae bacterium]